MTFIADLSPCWYLERDGHGGLVAIGWLAGDHPFSQGEVEPRARRRLAELLRHPYCHIAFMGSHGCDLCTGPPPAGVDPHSLRGHANLIVPGRDRLFACPELIGHYIDAHRYRPPDEFLEAVKECPEVGTEEYFLEIVRIGGSAWAEGLESYGRFMLETEARDPGDDPAFQAWLWTEQVRARNALDAVARWRASDEGEPGWRARFRGLFRRER